MTLVFIRQKIIHGISNIGTNTYRCSLGFSLLSLGMFYHCLLTFQRLIDGSRNEHSFQYSKTGCFHATKDLRNAIAHNDVIFDTRFRTGNIDKQVCNAISNATGVVGLNFETITDYVVLVVYQLSLLHISKNDMKRLITSFVECTEKLRKAIPTSVYNQIIRTDNNSKIAALRKFI